MPAEPVPNLSAYILTCNNEETLAGALRSVSDLAEEIVVVDSGSKDSTLDIAKQYTDRIIHQPWQGFRDQYQFAQDQCRGEWVIFLDADEELSPQLGEEIRLELARNQQRPSHAQIAGYRIPRRTFFLDRWILHGAWSSDQEIRLYKKALGRWEGGLHACVHIHDGAVATLRNFYYHFSYRNISEQIEKLNHYSTETAKEACSLGKTSIMNVISHPIWRFIKDYFLKAGFLDGMPGLVIAVNDAWYTFNKYAKSWELAYCQEERIKKIRDEERP